MRAFISSVVIRTLCLAVLLPSSLWAETRFVTNPLDAGPGSNTKWVNGDAVVYRFTLTLPGSAPAAAQGLTTGSHAFTWESRNQ